MSRPINGGQGTARPTIRFAHIKKHVARIMRKPRKAVGEEREGRASVERSEAGGCEAADAPRVYKLRGATKGYANASPNCFARAAQTLGYKSNGRAASPLAAV